MVEHGPQPPSALLAAAQADSALDDDEDLRARLLPWLHEGQGGPEDRPEDLLRVLQRLRLARLSDEAALLAAQAEHDPAAQAGYAHCLQRIRSLKAALADPGQAAGPV